MSISNKSVAVADGGQWMGCVSSHVLTNRPLVLWDTLEVFCRHLDLMTMDEATRL
jgi:hypothetical protein